MFALYAKEGIKQKPGLTPPTNAAVEKGIGTPGDTRRMYRACKAVQN